MGQVFKMILQVGTFLAILGTIAWFVAFETNPYAICIDHPNPKYSSKYYQCAPFNKVIKKPVPEKKFRDGKF